MGVPSLALMWTPQPGQGRGLTGVGETPLPCSLPCLPTGPTGSQVKAKPPKKPETTEPQRLPLGNGEQAPGPCAWARVRGLAGGLVLTEGRSCVFRSLPAQPRGTPQGPCPPWPPCSQLTHHTDRVSSATPLMSPCTHTHTHSCLCWDTWAVGLSLYEGPVPSASCPSGRRMGFHCPGLEGGRCSGAVVPTSDAHRVPLAQESRPCQLRSREPCPCPRGTCREPAGPWRGSSSSRCLSQVDGTSPLPGPSGPWALRGPRSGQDSGRPVCHWLSRGRHSGSPPGHLCPSDGPLPAHSPRVSSVPGSEAPGQSSVLSIQPHPPPSSGLHGALAACARDSWSLSRDGP